MVPPESEALKSYQGKDYEDYKGDYLLHYFKLDK